MANTPSLKRRDTVINIHLAAAWRQAEVERLDRTSAVRIEQNKLDLVLSCDPSPTHRYGAWLACWRRRMWPIAGLRSSPHIEDLEALVSALGQFERMRSSLPPNGRDINQYRCAEDIFAAERLLLPQTAKQLRDGARQRAHAGSDVLFDEGKWRLVRLKDKQAALWWGQGTRWCTAARTHNRFEAYRGTGDLLVLLTPAGRFQLATGTGEFRDAADSPASLDAILRSAPLLLKQRLLA